MKDIICLSNWRGTGGAQMNAAMLVDAFTKLGYEAELVFLFDREPDVDFAVNEFQVLYPSSPKGAWQWLVFIKRFHKLVSNRPNGLIIYGFQPFSNVIASIFSFFLRRVDVVGTQRNPSDSQSKNVARLEKFLGASIYKANICVSHSVKDSFSNYSKKYHQKLHVVHNGTPPLTKINLDKEACREKLGIAPNAFILGCLGRLHEQKNVAFAIDVVKACPNCVLYIAGTGPLELELRTQVNKLKIENRVVFLGPLYDERKTQFYKAIDVLLFPSIFEGFGRVLVEAMSEAVPVIANDISVLREVASNGAALLPLQTNVWVTTIQQFSQNESSCIELGINAKIRASKFSVDRMVADYLSLGGIEVLK
jgi:glycosyltransferase involved in cell wall biosynthesis